MDAKQPGKFFKEQEHNLENCQKTRGENIVDVRICVFYAKCM